MDEDKKPFDDQKQEIDANFLDEKNPPESFFHVTTKYKWILALSIILALAEGLLIYANVMGAVAAEIWQVAIWGVCVLLSVYAIIKKSPAAVLCNIVLVLGISLIPAWGMAYAYFRPIIELFTGSST